MDKDKVDKDKVDKDKVDKEKVDKDKADKGKFDMDKVDTDKVDKDKVDKDRVDMDKVNKDKDISISRTFLELRSSFTLSSRRKSSSITDMIRYSHSHSCRSIFSCSSSFEFVRRAQKDL